MCVRPTRRCFGLALLLLLAGCQFPQRGENDSPQLTTSGNASLGARIGLAPSPAVVTRGTLSETDSTVGSHSEAAEESPAEPDEVRAEQGAGIFRNVGKMDTHMPSAREDELPPGWTTELPPVTEPPGTLSTPKPKPKPAIALAKDASAAPPSEFLP